MTLTSRAMPNREPIRFFISHAGEDANLARTIGRQISESCQELRIEHEVFNTSEDQSRLIDNPNPTPNDKKTLVRYVIRNMMTSHIYIVLVTPNSLNKKSIWLQLEWTSYSAHHIGRPSLLGLRLPFIKPDSLLGRFWVRLEYGVWESIDARFRVVVVARDAIQRQPAHPMETVYRAHWFRRNLFHTSGKKLHYVLPSIGDEDEYYESIGLRPFRLFDQTNIDEWDMDRTGVSLDGFLTIDGERLNERQLDIMLDINPLAFYSRRTLDRYRRRHPKGN